MYMSSQQSSFHIPGTVLYLYNNGTQILACIKYDTQSVREGIQILSNQANSFFIFI